VDEGELQGRPLFRVGTPIRDLERRRVTASIPMAHERAIAAFLAEPAEREALRSDGRFIASPHHGDRGWFSIRFEEVPDWREVAELIDAAYRQVAPPSAGD